MFIYLASPYADESAQVRHARFAAVCRACGEILMEGKYTVYSPIAHFHSVAVLCGLPKTIEFWWSFNRDMLSECTELWTLTLDGWRESIGVQREIAFADQLGLKVKRRSPAK